MWIPKLLVFKLVLLFAVMIFPNRLLSAASPDDSLTSEPKAQSAEAKRLTEQTFELYGAGKVQDAIVLARHALEIRQNVQGKEHPDTAQTLFNLGMLLHIQREYAGARDCYEQALKIRKKVLGKEHLDTAESLNFLASLLQQQGDYAGARTYLEQVLKIRRKVLGNEHPDTAMSLNNLGMLLEMLGDHAASRKYYEEALAIRKKLPGNEPLDTAELLNNLARLLRTQGDYAGARPYLEQALQIQKMVLGDEHLETATSLNNLGLLLQAEGDYASARPYLEQALKIIKQVKGEEHPDTATPLNNLGMLLKDHGDYAGARPYLEQALKILKQVKGEEHPDTAVPLNNLGLLLHIQGDYAGARPYYEQALTILKQVKGEAHPDTAQSLNNLGMLFIAQGDYAGAGPYLEQALKIRMAVLGNEHPDTAQSLNNLGFLLQTEGSYASAWPYLEQALEIYKKVLGEEHANTALSLSNLACVEAGRNHWRSAANLKDQARRSIRSHIARVLPALSAREQLKFLQTIDEGPFHGAMTMGVLRHEDAKTSALSAGWLLNGKGVAQVALAERALLTRDVNDPKLAQTVQQLLEVRRKLAGLALAAPQPGKEAPRREMLEQLSAEDDRLSRELSATGGGPTRKNPWVELDEVQKALQVLPTQSVLIDIARFNVFDFQAKGKEKKWQPAHYAAWIIPPSGAVQVVDLGLADAIDVAVERARKSIEAASAKNSVLQKRGEPIAEQEVRKDLQAVTDLVWKPLSNKLGDAKQLFLSPDASLWLLPWCTLPTGENRFLIEDYAITYLISGRDLVSNQHSKTPTGPAVVVANPDFDMTADQVNAAMKAVFGNQPQQGGDETRALNAQTIVSQAERLPGSAREAKAIKSSIEQYGHAVPQVYTDQYALESIFKKVNRPKLAVLSTHGFFLPDQQVKQVDSLLVADTRSIALTVDGKPIENPLLRCGLLLAGCNSRQSAGGDDGILTGMEIVGIDLRGTELVVLSACETGVGQVRNGEGVAGLRQAFQLAGAESVVATLWKILDNESALIMKDFFTNLAQGQNKTDALRSAQLKRIAARRDKYGAAHPYFWAAFTLTGQ